MTRVANVMTLAFTQSNTNIEQLGYAMKYAAPMSRALGFSLEQTTAVVSKLSDAGIQGTDGRNDAERHACQPSVSERQSGAAPE
jgi:TP901 family phage tail tape measure protein